MICLLHEVDQCLKENRSLWLGKYIHKPLTGISAMDIGTEAEGYTLRLLKQLISSLVENTCNEVESPYSRRPNKRISRRRLQAVGIASQGSFRGSRPGF